MRWLAVSVGWHSNSFGTSALGCPTVFCQEEREALVFLSFFFARPLRLSRLIGEDHGPCPGRFCREECQSFEAAPILEETLSAAHNNRVDQQYQLIQKALFEEGGDEAGTSAQRFFH